MNKNQIKSIKQKIKETKVVKKLSVGPRQMVKSYLAVRPTAKITTEQLRNGINEKYNKNYTSREISNHLCQLRRQNIVKNVDDKGMNSLGLSVARWVYIPYNKR